MTESTVIANNWIQVFHEREVSKMLAALQPALEDQECDGIQNTYELTKGVVHYNPPYK